MEQEEHPWRGKLNTSRQARRSRPSPGDLLSRKLAAPPHPGLNSLFQGPAALSLLRFQFITTRQIITDKSGDGSSPGLLSFSRRRSNNGRAKLALLRRGMYSEAAAAASESSARERDKENEKRGKSFRCELIKKHFEATPTDGKWLTCASFGDLLYRDVPFVRSFVPCSPMRPRPIFFPSCWSLERESCRWEKDKSGSFCFHRGIS